MGRRVAGPLYYDSTGLFTRLGKNMIPTVRTHSRKLSPSTRNYNTDSRPLLEPLALALTSTTGSRHGDVVFYNLRQPNVSCWLQTDLQTPEIEVRFAPGSGHSEAPAGLPLVTRSGSFSVFQAGTQRDATGSGRREPHPLADRRNAEPGDDEQ